MTKSLFQILTTFLCILFLSGWLDAGIGQKLCLKLWIETSAFTDLEQALICGQTQLSKAHQNIFKNLGLFHLLVISGFHLHLLFACLHFFCRSDRGQHYESFLGVCLVFFTGAQIPLVRAVLQTTLQRWQQQKRFYWRPHFLVCLVHLIMIAIKPSLFLSLSLNLSTLAGSNLLVSRSALHLSALMYLTSLPLIASLGSPQWSGVLINALLAAPLSVLLLTISAAHVLTQNFFSWDWAWQIIMDLLECIQNHAASDLIKLNQLNDAAGLYVVAILICRIYGESDELPQRPFYWHRRRNEPVPK